MEKSNLIDLLLSFLFICLIIISVINLISSDHLSFNDYLSSLKVIHKDKNQLYSKHRPLWSYFIESNDIKVSISADIQSIINFSIKFI